MVAAAQTRGLQAQTRLLLSQELYESAEVVGSLMLCASRSAPQDHLPPTGDGSHTESLALYADALKGKGEFKRALSYYRQAAQRRRVGVSASGWHQGATVILRLCRPVRCGAGGPDRIVAADDDRCRHGLMRHGHANACSGTIRVYGL